MGQHLSGVSLNRTSTSEGPYDGRNGTKPVESELTSECRGNVWSRSRTMPMNSILKETILGHIACRRRRRRNSLEIMPTCNRVTFKRKSVVKLRGAISTKRADWSISDRYPTQTNHLPERNTYQARHSYVKSIHHLLSPHQGKPEVLIHQSIPLILP
jgi:hypothetical protein